MITSTQETPRNMNSEIAARLSNLAISITFLTFVAVMTLGKTALAAEPVATLSVQASGFQNGGGHAIANLFREGDDVLKLDKAYQHAKAEIHDGKATFSFPDLPYGKYAVSVFQDENDNGTLDHNALHFPAEPLGFSNHFSLGVFSGFPSFEKLQFPFSADTGVLEIVVK